MRRHLRIAAVAASLALLAGGGAAGFAAAAGNTYVVQPGDSLWAISRANGLTVAELATANGMNPNDILLIGRHLYIPAAAAQPDSDRGAVASSSPPAVTHAPTAKANPWTFCSTFRPEGGPWGQLPWMLQDSPRRLALQAVFDRWSSYYDLSLPLLEAIAWQESGWQQNVVSSAGAVGVGQLMPGTATFVAAFLIGRPMNIHSASDNIRMSAAFLGYLSGIEGNSRCSTIAAYYEGPLNMTLYGVFPETQAYVASVEALIPRFE